MGRERDYESEYEKKKNNQSDFQFTGGSEGLIENPPPGERRKRETIPVDQRHYKPGTATRNAKILAQRYSNLNQFNQQTQAKNLEEEQKQHQQNYQNQPQQVALFLAIPVAVIGGIFLVAVGATLLLQVKDENGETVTINEYASAPVADLLEQITDDIRNYYQSKGKEDLNNIRESVSGALNKILVREEPENEVKTFPNEEQGGIEHTGHAPPQVETGTPGFDSESGTKTPSHTGRGEREQPNARDFILESRRRNVQGHDDEGGHTDYRHIGKSEQWLRERIQREGLDEASSFYDYSSANLTQARFVKKYKKEIDAWLKSGEEKNFVEEITMNREVGIYVPRNGRVRQTKKAKVVLKKDNSELGYHARTSFPIP